MYKLMLQWKLLSFNCVSCSFGNLIPYFLNSEKRESILHKQKETVFMSFYQYPFKLLKSDLSHEKKHLQK